MTALMVILIAGAVIICAGAAAFFLIVINIQMVDRSNRLMSEPRNIFDASTRRLLGSTCSSGLRPTKRS
jgi:hypothetical protein